MYKSGNLKADACTCRDNLLAACAQARERARLGHENSSKLEEATNEIVKLTMTRDMIRECINHITSEYKNIESYAANRKALGLEMLKSAIERAGLIVPAADTANLKLEFFEKKARITDQFGSDVNDKEGSALRVVLGMLIRYTLLKVQPDAMQVMFLDEMFNTLSDETTAIMREYIDVFKEDTLIVGIEQHDVLFQGIDKIVFEAVKENGCTTIRKVG